MKSLDPYRESRGIVRIHALDGFYTAPKKGRYLVMGEEIYLERGESVRIYLSEEDSEEYLGKSLVTFLGDE